MAKRIILYKVCRSNNEKKVASVEGWMMIDDDEDLLEKRSEAKYKR